MKSKKLVCAAALLLASVGQAFAGEIFATVGTLADSVSLSVGGSQPVATYTVTLENKGTSNDINNARFVATTQVVNGGTATATYKSSNGATCTVTDGGTRVDCSVGALLIGQPKSFTLTFFSPTAGSSIALNWQSVFNNGSPPGGGNGNAATTSIALAAIDNAKVTSAVPASEQVLVFTGNRALPSSNDQFTTEINVPSANNKNSTATVDEIDNSTDTTCSSQRNFRKCFSSDISIPTVDLQAQGAVLTFTLRIDRSNIRPSSRIDQVVIRYTDPLVTVSNVQFCARDGSNNPIPNADKTPCIDTRQEFTRKTSQQQWTGYQWKLIGYKNGRYDLF